MTKQKRILKRSKISERKFREIVRYFALDLEVKCACRAAVSQHNSGARLHDRRAAAAQRLPWPHTKHARVPGGDARGEYVTRQQSGILEVLFCREYNQSLYANRSLAGKSHQERVYID